MFFVGFLCAFMIPIFCTAVAFNLLSCCIIITYTEMIIKARLCPCHRSVDD